MSTTTQPTITAVPPALEVPGPVTRVPSLEEIERLTEVPDRRVVFRGVDWAFYDQVVESIPEWCHLHVDYDGRDLEVVRKGMAHERARLKLDRIVSIAAEESEIPYSSGGQTTWKRPALCRGIEADESYYFLPAKMEADAMALQEGSDDIADYPNPDLAIEVDITPSQVDRAGIYAALGVAEVWRFDGSQVVIERLTPEGKFVSSDASGFLPVRADTIRRWVVEEDSRDESAWARRLRAEVRTRVASQT
jgi:Uma2 family endonuclease